jgi:hypothetical protein
MQTVLPRSIALACWLLAACASPAGAVDLQPLRAQAHRIADALVLAGAPLSSAERARLDSSEGSAAEQIAAIQAVLDPFCLAQVEINPESRVRRRAGQTDPARLARVSGQSP